MRHILSPSATLFHADCRDALRELTDNSIDSVVTDPPYALVSVVKRFGGANAAPAKGNDAYMRASAGFMGKSWDTGECAMDPTFWVEVLRVLKPGAHLVAFGASRGYHRMACAIEDAGFEIRDSLMWVYGTGFPKSHDVSKGIDREAGAEREVIGEWNIPGRSKRSSEQKYRLINDSGFVTAPATAAAREWEGWGTALKPAFEPIVLARKPLSENTVAANVLRWRTGALNIDASRINSWTEADLANMAVSSRGDSGNASTNFAFKGSDTALDASKGRWPANVVHDGSDEVVGEFPHTNGSKRGVKDPNGSMGYHGGASGLPGVVGGYDDAGGSAARFFYSAKASKQDRNGSKHPTVKSISLMEWLCTLITPPGGTVLDPFAGSGTTGIAAQNKGFQVVLCEREAEYVTDIKARFAGSSPGEWHQYRNLRTAETTWQQEQ